MEFEGGVTAAFSMVAFTKEMCQRKTTIYGSMVGLKWMWSTEKKTKSTVITTTAIKETQCGETVQ